jgi:hypothetical protein
MSKGTKRQLVIVMKPGIAVPPSLHSNQGLSNMFAFAPAIAEKVRVRPLFRPRSQRKYASPGFRGTSPNVELDRYFHVDGPDDQLESVHKHLLKHTMVETAFIKPPTYHAALNKMLPSAAPAPSVTPDFGGRQGYLDPAPGGVDARYAWTVPGGDGSGVSVIDVEGEWRFSHEDLQGKGGVVAGTPPGDPDWRNHGTAVIGTICANANGFGVTGIAPGVNLRAISIFPDTFGSAAAIQQAADLLGVGDIILLEMHRAGPRFDFDDSRADQKGFIAIEWWPDDLAAIQYATAKGIIVVEAGGNGAENLDDTIYDLNPTTPNGPFPATWTNPFRRNPVDSGAIVVGAGAPPTGTHNNNWGPDRSRLDFSNFGSIVDCQGWGREVTTCGYGDLQAGVTEDTWYTDTFSGTSSASPVVVGSLACVQGAFKAAGNALLTPASARNLLRSSGSPQADSTSAPASSERIGNRPDIRQMIQNSVGTSTQATPVQAAPQVVRAGQNPPDRVIDAAKATGISIVFNIYTGNPPEGE